MIETTTSVTASGSSGGACSMTGPYYCNTHTDTVLFFEKGKTFSNCPISKSRKGHAAAWSMMNDSKAVPISTADSLAVSAEP